MTFEGAARWDSHAAAHGGHDDHHGHGGHKPHESPITMLLPLLVLAIGALASGFFFKEAFIGHDYAHFWKGALFTSSDNKILEEMHHVPIWVGYVPFVMMVLGFLMALWMYLINTGVPARLAAAAPGLYRFLLNKWYFDELYDVLFVRSAKRLGTLLWKGGDGAIIDGLGPNGIAARVLDVTRGAMRLQSGYVYHYAFAMLIGVAAFVSWYLVGGGVR